VTGPQNYLTSVKLNITPLAALLNFLKQDFPTNLDSLGVSYP